MAIKEIVVPESVRKDLLKLPANVRELFYKKLDLYLSNPFHRSLRVHSLKSRPGVKSLSITRHYRATFYIEGERLIIEAVGSHEIYRQALPWQWERRDGVYPRLRLKREGPSLQAEAPPLHPCK